MNTIPTSEILLEIEPAIAKFILQLLYAGGHVQESKILEANDIAKDINHG